MRVLSNGKATKKCVFSPCLAFEIQPDVPPILHQVEATAIATAGALRCRYMAVWLSWEGMAIFLEGSDVSMSLASESQRE